MVPKNQKKHGLKTPLFDLLPSGTPLRWSMARWKNCRHFTSLVMTSIAMEHCHWNSGFSLTKWWFSSSLCKRLPEGKTTIFLWFSYDFPMIFPYICHIFSHHNIHFICGFASLITVFDSWRLYGDVGDAGFSQHFWWGYHGWHRKRLVDPTMKWYGAPGRWRLGFFRWF